MWWSHVRRSLPAALVLAAAAVIDADPGLAAIEAALVENMQSWRSLRDFDRCNSRRLELLEQTLAFPLTSDADAATALRVALKACGEDDWANEQVDWGTIGRPEDVIRVNIVRKVQRYLSGEPQEQAQAA